MIILGLGHAMTVEHFGRWYMHARHGKLTSRNAKHSKTGATVTMPESLVRAIETTGMRATPRARYARRMVGALLSTLAVLPADLWTIVIRACEEPDDEEDGHENHRALWNVIKAARMEARRRRPSAGTPPSDGAPPARP